MRLGLTRSKGVTAAEWVSYNSEAVCLEGWRRGGGTAGVADMYVLVHKL